LDLISAYFILSIDFVLSHRIIVGTIFISPLSTILTEAQARALDIADSRVAGPVNARPGGFPNG
jgi:hypothetical protein